MDMNRQFSLGLEMARGEIVSRECLQTWNVRERRCHQHHHNPSLPSKLRGLALITTTITIITIITIVIREMPRGQTRDAGKVKIVETEGKISIMLGGIIIINYRPLSMWGLSWTGQFRSELSFQLKFSTQEIIAMSHLTSKIFCNIPCHCLSRTNGLHEKVFASSTYQVHLQ